MGRMRRWREASTRQSNARDLEMIRLLAKAGANIDEADPPSGRPPLHFALQHSMEVVELLLELGASPNVRTVTGEAPLDMAISAFPIETPSMPIAMPPSISRQRIRVINSKARPEVTLEQWTV